MRAFFVPGLFMADKQKTIEIIFGGVDKTGSVIKSVGSNLSSLEQNVGNITGPLANITDKILTLDGVLAAAAVGLTAYAVKAADDFGTSFAEIATLIDAPAESLTNFQNEIQQYAEGSTQSFDEITKATYSAISAGVDYRDALSVIQTAEELAVAGRADLGSTTNALVSVMNAFGASMDESNAYADTFFTTVKLGQTTIPELASSISRVAPIASAAGITFEELSAAIATITAETGTGTAETMTALKSAISNILKPSKQASDLAAELGIQFDATALKSKGLKGVLDDVAKATKGNTEQMAALFPNTEALNAVLPLTGKAADAFTKSLEAMAEKAGVTKEAYALLESDLQLLGQTLENNVTSVFIELGKRLLEESGSLIQSLTSIFKSIGSELRLDNGVFEPLLNLVESVVQDIETKFAAIATNLPDALKTLDLTTVIQSFDKLGDSLDGIFEAMFGDIDITTVEGLSSAIQTISDAFAGLVELSAGIIDGMKPLFELLGEGAKGFHELGEDTKAAIGQVLGLAKSIDTVLPVLGSLGSGLESVGSAVLTLAGVNGITKLSGSFSGLASSLAGKTGLVGAAAAAGLGIGELINQTIEWANDGQSLGSLIYDWVHGTEALAEKTSATAAAQAAAVDAANDYAQSVTNGADALQATNDVKALDIDLLNQQAAKYLEAAKQQNSYTQSVKDSEAAQTKSVGALSLINSALESGGEAVKTAVQHTEALAKNNKSLAVTFDESGQKIVGWSGTIVKSTGALDAQAKKVDEVIKKSEAYQLKLLEIASDERIQLIKSKVELDIAKLEADTAKAKEIIKSLTTTIQSTGTLIGSLFGNLNESSGLTKIAIANQIDLENKRRQEALNMQKELTKAQIENIRAKTQSVKKGDSLIKIEASNLAPALELIFVEILKEVQVRANEEGLNLLVGI